MTQLGFIGFGKMAEALWIAYRSQSDTSFGFYEPNPERAAILQERYGATCHDSIETLVAASDTVLLCIKPQTLPDISPTLKQCIWDNKMIVSILAGIPLARFDDIAPKLAAARVMPNTPLQVGEGFSGVCFQHTTPKQEAHVMSLFAAGGSVLSVPESTINAITGISGSGPAFLYQLTQAVIAVGKTHGLSDADTRQCMAQTMIGAGKMMLTSDTPLETLISQVTSPGGTTAAGLAEMQRLGVDLDFGNVILKAIIRAEELAQPTP
jgi:pyrroline-5-carboxylate reductase